MSNGCRWVVTLTFLLALTGCSSPARLSSHLTRITAVPDPVTATPQTGTERPTNYQGETINPAAAKVADKELPREEDPPPVSTPVVPNPFAFPRPTDDWISLETWSETNHLGAARLLPTAIGPVFAVHAPGGVITLMAGSQLAHLDGTGFWLGYAPRFAEGRLLVHTLDAQKNLLPLAHLPAFPADAGRVVVIDPGHGGGNTGTRSVADQHWEKEFTLDWALRLRPLLAGNGWKVVLTRTNDVDVSLADRVALADRVNADLFISLHFNSGAHDGQAGLETYCLTPTGVPSTLTRDYEDDTTRVFPNNGFDRQNLQAALRLHRTLLQTTGGTDRGVRRARFMTVLRDQNRGAVLVEGGYLSNPREARAIADPEYRQKLAEAVARGLK